MTAKSKEPNSFPWVLVSSPQRTAELLPIVSFIVSFWSSQGQLYTFEASRRYYRLCNWKYCAVFFWSIVGNNRTLVHKQNTDVFSCQLAVGKQMKVNGRVKVK